MGRVESKILRQRVLEAVTKSDVPLTVENVRTLTGLHSWESTKSTLLELTLEGEISSMRVGSHRVFGTAASFQVQQLRP